MISENLPPDQGAELGLLDEFAEQYFTVPASLGQRFLNYLIDNLLMRYGLSYASGAAIGGLLAVVNPDMLSEIASDSNSFMVYLFAYLITILNYLAYYTFCEKVFKGHTLGKLITGTKAVSENGDPLTLRQAFFRSLSRLVPFEPFSAFGQQPWHDSWTHTKVIKTR